MEEKIDRTNRILLRLVRGTGFFEVALRKLFFATIGIFFLWLAYRMYFIVTSQKDLFWAIFYGIVSAPVIPAGFVLCILYMSYAVWGFTKGPVNRLVVENRWSQKFAKWLFKKLTGFDPDKPDSS